MEWHVFPRRSRRKSCEFGASACDFFTSPDWQPGQQRKRNSTCINISSTDPIPKATSSLTSKETKALYLRARTMPQERSKYSKGKMLSGAVHFPLNLPFMSTLQLSSRLSRENMQRTDTHRQIEQGCNSILLV